MSDPADLEFVINDIVFPGTRRVWTEDNMNWIMVPEEADAGAMIQWAGKHYRLTSHQSDGKNRAKEIKRAS